MTIRRRTAALALFAPLLAAAPLAAQELRIATGGSVISLDPHFYNATPNNAVSLHLFDRLGMRDAQSRLQPALALSWQPISETEWEFKLRPNVTWHDGKPFTADDVAFTIARTPTVPNSPGGFAGFVRAVTKVEVVDPLTLRVQTRGAYPNLPSDLSSLAIIARHAAEGAATEDFNSGKAAVGTGPYRFVNYRANDRTELARNESWWGGAQPWAKVSYRFISNDGARTAALLAGDVDVIDQVSATDLPRLRRESRVALAETQGLRVIYLTFDRSRREAVPFVTDNAGQPLPRNPFDDARVRRALSIALQRDALAERVMEGTATPTGQWMPPGTFGYNPEIKPPAYAPDRARALLAEAGYPQGFRLTLHSPNDRYPNDAKTAQAVAQMWTRIGVQTQVDALPWASFAPRSARQDFAARLTGWGSSTADASSMLVNILGTYDRARSTGANNAGRYSNPELDALRDRALATLDNERREALLREAVAMAEADTAMIPLFMLTNVWATRRGVTYEARMDEATLAMSARPE
ncbi:ABC transporter substrate-binding protein [Pseudoroseomonas cervicalis]|uniref:ABC transporter, substrate-binding protein, family 5 n=1 Tax=Pseudoroseomonas cervicalis ATCC 49957 TaxID=525371 RepID=D5RP82_9PROT|nr:ABC transporter substrate-binding protein [Pseudoroseomonas cervicalis]EFH10879.1 ABC transporter, substrate-binding protein, family 5 [Pseudoroseomonas cervicalis ATCC 49957]